MPCRRRLRRIAANTAPAAAQHHIREEFVLKTRIKFSKEGNLRFVGHLDMMRYFQKANRRAELPVAYSEGVRMATRIYAGRKPDKTEGA